MIPFWTLLLQLGCAAPLGASLDGALEAPEAPCPAASAGDESVEEEDRPPAKKSAKKKPAAKKKSATRKAKKPAAKKKSATRKAKKPAAKKSTKGKKPKPLVLEGGGVRWEIDRPLPRVGRRTAKTEAAALVAFQARVRIREAFAYRQKTLAPGEYTVGVEARAEGRHILAFRKAPAKRRRPASEGKSSDSAAPAVLDLPLRIRRDKKEKTAARPKKSEETDGRELRVTWRSVDKGRRGRLDLRIGASRTTATLRRVDEDESATESRDADAPVKSPAKKK